MTQIERQVLWFPAIRFVRNKNNSFVAERGERVSKFDHDVWIRQQLAIRCRTNIRHVADKYLGALNFFEDCVNDRDKTRFVLGVVINFGSIGFVKVQFGSDLL